MTAKTSLRPTLIFILYPWGKAQGTDVTCCSLCITLTLGEGTNGILFTNYCMSTHTNLATSQVKLQSRDLRAIVYLRFLQANT